MTFTITITTPQIITYILIFLVSFIISYIQRRKTIKEIEEYNSITSLVNSIRLSGRY